MKSTYFAVLLSFSLLFSCDLSAEARPASSHSGTSSGFKGGFSSQKGNYGRSAPAPSPPPAQRSGPGFFGKAGGADAPPPQPSRSGSALSRDMEQNAAQANALKTLDARRNAQAAANNPPLPPLRDPVMRPQQPGQAPVYNQPGYAQQNLPPQQPIIVQQPNNGFMSGVVGFMLGRAMSHPQPVYYPQNNGGQGNGGNNGGNGGGNGGDWDSGQNTTLAGSTGATGAAAMTPVPQAAPAPSFGATVLRTFVWLALVSGLVWLVIYTVRKLRRLRSANAAHYSFERN